MLVYLALMGTLAQFLVLPVVWLLTKLFSNEIEFRNEDNFLKVIGKPVVIIANHISSYDSFLLRLSKYWTSFRVYFMGVKRFNSSQLRFLNSVGIIGLVYKLFGVLTVEPGRGLEKNLEPFAKVLLKNNAIFIFPEGSMNKSNELLPFKLGAAALAISTNTLILPIGFNETRIKGKRKTVISIGEPILFQPTTDYVSASKQLEDIIKRLRASA